MGVAQSVVRHSVDLLPEWVRTRVHDMPLVKPLQRWLLDRFIGSAPFDYTLTAGPAKGARFRIDMPQDKLIWTGTYESEFAGELSRHVRPGSVCYDIGGYRGYMTAVMAVAGAARTIVFEPNPENLATLTTLSNLNPVLSLSILPYGLGNTDGEVEFELLSDRSMGRLVNVGLIVDQPVVARFGVTLRRIDTMVSTGEIPAPDLMKIDVEGAELQVLQGSSETIRAKHPVMLLEAHSIELAAACTSFLEGEGYRVGLVQGEGQWAVTKHLVAVAL